MGFAINKRRETQRPKKKQRFESRKYMYDLDEINERNRFIIALVNPQDAEKSITNQLEICSFKIKRK